MPEVEIPSRCVHFEEGMDACNVVKNGWRDRETGPCHPLRKAKCHHGPGYTLYPPGYGPYLQAPVAPVNGAGEIVLIGEGEESGTSGELGWWRTLFAAALDAALGLSWSRESPADDPRRRRTQRRYIVLAATLLGLATDLEKEIAQRVAECLGVAWLLLSDQRKVFRSALTYKGRGAAIASVLELVPVDRSVSHRLLKAGFITGLWGYPRRWDPG